MSYLLRLSSRIIKGSSKSTILHPKGVNSTQHNYIHRTEDDKETISPKRFFNSPTIHRQEEVEEETQAQRKTDEDKEEPIATLRRQEEVEETEEDGNDISPLRRMEEEGDEPDQSMRTLSRQEEVPLEDNGSTTSSPSQNSLEPESEPVSQEFSSEEEPSQLQALHSESSRVKTQNHVADNTEQSSNKYNFSEQSLDANRNSNNQSNTTILDLDNATYADNSTNTFSSNNDVQPTITIDQVDVLIQEPHVTSNRASSTSNHNHYMRSRYLRRL